MRAPGEPEDHNDQPVVSVAVTTYNSARWLPRAVDSILRQRVEFPIEIVVGDDCSQDHTIEVAESYSGLYPGKVRVIARPKNIGIQHNYFETFEQCRGKYIAWLDADDYWTDPDKLRLQVELLESDPSVSLCGHYVREVFSDGGVKSERYPSRPSGRYDLGDVVGGLFIPTLSVVFRNGIHRALPEWYFDLAPMTDKPIYVLAALSGDIMLLDRVMADYVFTPGSANTSKGDLFTYQVDAKFYENIESILPERWHRTARAVKGTRYEAIAYLLRKQGMFTASRNAALRAFWSPSLMDNCVSKTKSLIAAIVREVEWRLRGGRATA